MAGDLGNGISGGKKNSVRPPSSLAYKTFTNFLDTFKDTPIPSHIDKGVLPSSMSGGNQAYLTSALKFFGLISDSGETQEDFRTLVQIADDERIAVWRNILTSAYDFLLREVNIESATTRIVADKFKEQEMSGDTIRKAMTFFVYAAKDAGLSVSPHIKPQQLVNSKPKSKPNNSKTNNDVKKDIPSSNVVETKQPREPTVIKELAYELIDILGDDMDQTEQDAVWTLIKYLKRRESVSLD